MKKKLLTSLLMLTIALTVVACGNSNNVSDKKEDSSKEETIEETSEETTEESEEVNEDESTEEIDEVTEEEPEEEGPVTYEPLQEILDAEFYEMKFQVDDFIIQINYDETVADFVAKLPEGYTTNYNMDYLVSPSEWTSLKIYKGTEEDGEHVFTITVWAYETAEIGTLPYRDLSFNRNYSGSLYLAKGLDVIRNFNDYSDDERFTYENIVDTFESWGAVPTDSCNLADELLAQPSLAYYTSNNLDYTLIASCNVGYITQTSGLGALVMFPSYQITFSIDNATRHCEDSITFRWDRQQSSWCDPTYFNLTMDGERIDSNTDSEVEETTEDSEDVEEDS